MKTIDLYVAAIVASANANGLVCKDAANGAMLLARTVCQTVGHDFTLPNSDGEYPCHRCLAFFNLGSREVENLKKMTPVPPVAP